MCSKNVHNHNDKKDGVRGIRIFELFPLPLHKKAEGVVVEYHTLQGISPIRWTFTVDKSILRFTVFDKMSENLH